MRNKERIKPFMEELTNLWETQCPDWRFTQFIDNVFATFEGEPFFYEEEETLEKFKKYFNKEK